MTSIWIFKLFVSFAVAQSSTPVSLKCLKLENFSIGCVPSSREVCHSGQPMNCDLTNLTVACHYIKGRGKYYKPSDAFHDNFECAAREDPICPPGTTDIGICQLGACIRYKPPHCQLDCHQCYRQPMTSGSAPIHGCIRHCGEKYCTDEPNCEKFRKAAIDCQNPNNPTGCEIQPCPTTVNNCEAGPSLDPVAAAEGVDRDCFYIPRIKRPLCQESTDCPPVRAPPEVNSGNCFYDAPNNTDPCVFREEPPGSGNRFLVMRRTRNECEIPPFSQMTLTHNSDRVCPWIEYERRHNDMSPPPPDEISCASAPVTLGNRFPCDCCECNSNASGCKMCGPNALPYCGTSSSSCP